MPRQAWLVLALLLPLSCNTVSRSPTDLPSPAQERGPARQLLPIAADGSSRTGDIDWIAQPGPLLGVTATRYHGDLPMIRRHGVLRVLVRRHEGSYYLDDGDVHGFEYALLQRFAGQLGVQLELVVPALDGSLADGLRAGRGDLIGMPLAPGPVDEAPGIQATVTYRDRASGTAPAARVWATRDDTPLLRARLNAFIHNEYRGVGYNVLKRRYLEPQPAAAGGAPLSPYDAQVRPLAERYGFDWRLIVAQMYQESRFDPDARSPSGARGLMQVMPATGRELGFDDLTRPETSIRAGIMYLAKVRDRFERTLPAGERRWFALAAYNSGYSRVDAARRLAIELGLDSNRWFGQVERAMAELPHAASSIAESHRHCSCLQPVNYVRAVRLRYAAYARIGVDASDEQASLWSPGESRLAAAEPDSDAEILPGSSRDLL